MCEQEGKKAWLETLRHWYGDEVVQSRDACFHCLARGKVLHQWHEESGMRLGGVPKGAESAFDHTSLWRIGNEPLAFVTQPYHFRHETMRTLLDYCDQHGLEMEIDEAASFHYHGHCVPIVIYHRATREKYTHDRFKVEARLKARDEQSVE